MKDMIRVGHRWFNPAHLSMAEIVEPTVPGEQPGLRLHLNNKSDPIWELAGDSAELVLKLLGYDKAAREAEIKEKQHAEKASHDKEVHAAKAAHDKTVHAAEKAAKA